MKYWRSVSRELQYGLVSSCTGVAGPSSFELLDAVILSPETEEPLRQWARDLREAKY